MSFWTFFLYFVGAIILLEIVVRVILVIIVAIIKSGERNTYNRMPNYRYTPTAPKLFTDHKSGELRNKLGDLAPKNNNITD